MAILISCKIKPVFKENILSLHLFAAGLPGGQEMGHMTQIMS
jgi:hypothetical protein